MDYKKLLHVVNYLDTGALRQAFGSSAFASYDEAQAAWAVLCEAHTGLGSGCLFLDEEKNLVEAHDLDGLPAD